MRLTRLAPAVFLVLWSAGFAFVALGLPDTEPLTFLALRYAAVVVLLAGAFVLLRPALPAGRAGWLALVVGGVLVQGLYFALLYLALDLGLAAGTVALVVSLQPVLVALAAPRVTGDRVGLSRWIGLMIGLLGAVLVIVAQDAVRGGAAGAMACAVGALLALSAGALHENRYGIEAHPVTANLVSCSIALLLTAAGAAALEDLHVDWTTDLAISLTYLVVANTLVSITLLLAMLRNGEAARVSALFFLVPPLAALIAWAMLGEHLDNLAWAGMAVAAVGVGIASRGQAKPSENAPADT
jgi:drug/metabolite transporter (DMT)-like permease